MLKKLVLSCVLATAMSGSLIGSDNPIIRPGDADTIADNFASIGKNLYQVGENSARIIVRGAVKLSSGFAQGTKFMADHPIFGLSCIAGAGWAWYKWRQKNAHYKSLYGRDMTLIDLWRTTTEHWGPRRA